MAFAFLHGLRTQDLKYTFSGGYAKIPKLAARLFDHQATEAFLRCRALTRMTQLGMPESYAVAA